LIDLFIYLFICLFVSESPTSSPTEPPDLTGGQHGSDDHTLEYTLLIVAIVLVTTAAIVYVVYFQKPNTPSEEELSRAESRGKKKGGFEAVSSFTEGGDVDVDKVDSSLFQIELVGEEEGGDEEEELVF
jgi:hypothetical protein